MEKIAKKYVPLIMASLALTIIVFWGKLSNPLTTDIALPSKLANNLPIAHVTAADWVEMMENFLNSAYVKAVEDAKEVKASEISNNLWAISKNNQNLSWNSQDEVLVVTWTYSGKYQKDTEITLKKDEQIWVTPVPQVKNFCKALPFEQSLRLEQYIGLPPHNGKTEFVEMWVNPSQIFRPCKDPEINDTSCSLNFPENVSSEHKQWFEKTEKSSYVPTKSGLPGYPWTQLGYTYDWGSIESELVAKEVAEKDGKDIAVKEVVASEFVIQSGSLVKIKSIHRTRDYCQSSL
jgi:hypothetical protein